MKISIKVIPNSKEQKIKKEPDGSLKVYLKSPAKEGKANEELVKVLAKYFNITKSDVSIKVGQTSKNKIAVIDKE